MELRYQQLPFYSSNTLKLYYFKAVINFVGLGVKLGRSSEIHCEQISIHQAHFPVTRLQFGRKLGQVLLLFGYIFYKT